jgi:hypothetical protein
VIYLSIRVQVITTYLFRYWEALLGMEVTVKSLDVVISLEKSMELPKEHLRLYLSQCMHRCYSEIDDYVRNRLVRLVGG